MKRRVGFGVVGCFGGLDLVRLTVLLAKEGISAFVPARQNDDRTGQGS